MPVNNNNQNITLPYMVMILTIISMAVGSAWGVASIKSSVDVLTSKVVGMEKKLDKNDNRLRTNENRLTHLETLSLNKQKISNLASSKQLLQDDTP